MPNIVFDASSIVGAALKPDSTPELALLLARSHATICLSSAVEAEIRDVLQRPKCRKYITDADRGRILDILGAAALRFEPVDQVPTAATGKTTNTSSWRSLQAHPSSCRAMKTCWSSTPGEASVS